MNGFGTIDKKDINVLISSIENRINFIRNDINQNVTSLKNQLNACTEELNRLKKLVIQVTNYNDSEYQKLENRINQFDSDIEDIKSKLNTIQYNEIAAGKCASGINEYPIYAKYAENDTNGNIIPEYYAAKYDLSNVSSTLSADYTSKIAESSSGGMSALSYVSAQLHDSIENEVQERSEADIILKNSIVSETTRALKSESNINTKIDEEISRSTNKDTILEQKITIEQNRAETAESNLQESLSNETSRAKEEENKLRTNLKGEIERATDIESGLRTDLDDEIARAKGVETTIQTSLQENIDKEVTRATNAENELQNKIDSEATSRETADNTIQTNLSNEITRATGELTNNLNSEIKRAENAESELDKKINTNTNEIYDTISSISGHLSSSIISEYNDRVSVDISLQNQIDTIEATQNVIDLVADYAALTAYDTTNVKVNDKIQVICDETSANQTTIYSWNNNTWNGIGMFGPYYTKSQVEEEITKAINTEKTERESVIEELNTNKQNNLTAGDGISISNDVISHSIKIIENNNEEDKVEGTTFTVYLKNNHYKIITFDKTITSIKFIIESSTNNVLQETGFEFTCPDESVLEQINFEVKDNPNKKIYTILPDSYTGLNIYQGTIVNYKCTIGEYEVEN